MKWATFHTSGDPAQRVGVLEGETVHAAAHGTTLLDCFGDSPAAFSRTGQALLRGGEAIPTAEVCFDAPISRPPSIRDFMMFEEHVINSYKGMGRPVDPLWYQQPVFYFTNPAAVTSASAPITIAPGSVEFDYELELGAVIGWPAADVCPEGAEELIAGYTLLIDWSARDLQRQEMKVGLGPAKGKDTATTLGPVLVTPDELEPAGAGFDLPVTIQVGEQEYGRRTFANMYWPFADAISYAARGTSVVPGDVFGSGTCGQGCILELQALHGAEPYRWLRPGDHVTIEAAALGRIETDILAGPTAAPLSRAAAKAH